MKFSKAALLSMTALAASEIQGFVAQSVKIASPSFAASTQSRTALNMGLFSHIFERKDEKAAIVIPPPQKISAGQVRSLFYLWNDALATGDSHLVAKRYAEDPILLPAASDEPRTDFDSIKGYFDIFLKLQPQGVVLDGKIKIGRTWAKDAGIYEFTMRTDGSKVKARYNFIYVYEDGQWKISHHHSSVMPEAKSGVKISKDQVQNLFHLWNDAIDTGDSSLVASRYSKNAVLLPTVSDTPRTDFEGIKNYFDNFLKLKPQGEILESHVVVGEKWCKDVGIYEFTMGTDGSKVKARYTFVYVYEDGAWKINHHHSSAMPEAKIGEDISKEQVRELFGLWNNALATLDSDAVAMRYAPEAVLLPTVSDIPRTDYNSIKDYFDNFLEKKPQGVILESHVTIGENWCKDVGIYEFAMGVDDSKVKARYSFVYTFDKADKTWKIIHHHSSAMPERGMLAGAKDDKDMLEGKVKEVIEEDINGVEQEETVSA